MDIKRGLVALAVGIIRPFLVSHPLSAEGSYEAFAHLFLGALILHRTPPGPHGAFAGELAPGPVAIHRTKPAAPAEARQRCPSLANVLSPRMSR